jgi:hypothetical protein
VSDYVSPPRVISSERTGKEVTWSMGEYISGRDIWKSFGLPGNPPERVGVYENQPFPLSADTTKIWLACVGFLVVLVLMFIAFESFAGKDRVIEDAYYVFDSSARGDASFVTDVFQLKGHTSDLQVTTQADVNNNWIYLNYALINQDTGQAYDFGREVSYYQGYDEDGSWSEGSRSDTVAIPSVPPGNYYFRIEPESDLGRGTIRYWLSAKRDVPQASFFGIALLALLLPAGLITWRSMNFEHLRWAESDYGGSASDDDNSNDTNPPISLFGKENKS